MPVRKQLAIFLENRPGHLARIGDAFTTAKINIRAITVSDTVDHAVVRLVVDDPPKALRVLEEASVLVQETEVLEAPLPNRPGVLAGFAKRLAKEGINIDYAYGSTLDDPRVPANLYLRVSDTGRAAEVLEEYLKQVG